MSENLEKIMERIGNGRQFRRNDLHPEFRTVEREDEDAEESMIVEGHACTFNEQYCMYDGRYYKIFEQIDPHAFDECDMSDVIMQYDHAGRVMARNRNNTLELTVDEKGLLARADLSKSELGPGLYRDIKNGIIDRMSFAFTVAEDKREETEDYENDVITVLRTITKIGKLYDVSAVSIPANDGTDISARSYCDGVIAELEAERLKKAQRAKARKALELRLKLMEE